MTWLKRYWSPMLLLQASAAAYTSSGGFGLAGNKLLNGIEPVFENLHGSLLVAFAWLLGDRGWLWIGTVTGPSIGLMPVAAGQHFLSDTVFAFWIVYGACLLSARVLLGDTRVA